MGGGMMQYAQLVEMVGGRLPKIWLINTAITGDRITFELGYLGDGYGAKNAVLAPDGCIYPQYTVSVPSQCRNLPNGVPLIGGYFTIEKIETE